MRKFRLKPKCGNHIEKNDKGEPITYKSGNVVPSDRDLVAMYPNKFEIVLGQDSEKIVTAPKIPAPIKNKGKGKKKKSIDEDVIYNRDGTIYKDMDDPTIDQKKTPESEEILSEHGIDVTKDFPTASKVELKVFEKSKWFTVVDPDNNEVLNDKKLRRKKVEDFLADYLQEEDDDDDDDEDEEEDED